MIWEHIKDKVAIRLFEEFGSLYTGIQDQHFIDLINTGEYVTLRSFQKELSESKGYRQFCRATMASNDLFFKMSRAVKATDDACPLEQEFDATSFGI